MSKCPTGTGYKAFHPSHHLFFAETQRLQVSHLCPVWDSKGTPCPAGTPQGERAKGTVDTWDRRDTWDSWDGMTDAERQGCRRSVDHAKNSAVEGEREKRDDQGHASQCNYDFNHPGSIGRKFLTLGESL